MAKLPNLLVPRSEAKGLLKVHIEKSPLTRMTSSEGSQKKSPDDKIGDVEPSLKRLKRWQERIKTDLLEIFDSLEIAEEFKELTEGMILEDNADANAKYNWHDRILRQQVKWIESLEKRLSIYKEPTRIVAISTQNYPAIVQNICNRFNTVVRQLRRRYDNRKTLDVKDEYDVQDLLHALLRLYFDDVRAEEYTPSYAGGASRVDFLIKKEQIVIEVKKTRSTLKDKHVGEQLVIDINRYRGHPNCKFLFCFVYDPDGYINNPAGLEADLSRIHDGLQVKVFIAPKSH